MDDEIKCVFVSVYNDITEVRSDAVYNPLTGKVDILQIPDIDESENVLTRQYIEVKNGEDEERLEVCMSCHEYLLKPVVGDTSDLGFDEFEECRNPECPSKGEDENDEVNFD